MAAAGDELLDGNLVDPTDVVIASEGEIIPNYGARGRVLIDEVGGCGAARKGLDADAAGAGIEVEHAIGFNVKRTEGGKERFLDLVGHRPSPRSSWPFEPASLGLARDHAHAATSRRLMPQRHI